MKFGIGFVVVVLLVCQAWLELARLGLVVGHTTPANIKSCISVELIHFRRISLSRLKGDKDRKSPLANQRQALPPIGCNLEHIRSGVYLCPFES